MGKRLSKEEILDAIKESITDFMEWPHASAILGVIAESIDIGDPTTCPLYVNYNKCKVQGELEGHGLCTSYGIRSYKECQVFSEWYWKLRAKSGRDKK